MSKYKDALSEYKRKTKKSGIVYYIKSDKVLLKQYKSENGECFYKGLDLVDYGDEAYLNESNKIDLDAGGLLPIATGKVKKDGKVNTLEYYRYLGLKSEETNVNELLEQNSNLEFVEMEKMKEKNMALEDRSSIMFLNDLSTFDFVLDLDDGSPYFMAKYYDIISCDKVLFSLKSKDSPKNAVISVTNDEQDISNLREKYYKNIFDVLVKEKEDIER